MKRQIAVLLAGGLALGLCGCAWLPKEEELPAPPVYRAQEVEYEQAQVERGDLQVWDSISCSYTSAVEEKLCFQVGGLEITDVFVQSGDEVSPGQLLAQLESTDIEDEIAAQEDTIGGLQLQKQQLNDTRAIERERESVEQQQLAEKVKAGKASQQSYDAAVAASEAHETAYASQMDYLAAQISIEQGRLDSLNGELEQRRIYAGISGTVRSVSHDEISTTSYPFITVADYSTNRFVATLKENELSILPQGKTVTVEMGMQEFEATVASVEADEGGTTYTATLEPTSQIDLSANAARGRIPYLVEESLDTLFLPVKAVQINSTFSVVYYLDDNGALSTKVVTIGIQTKDYVEIKEGVKEGEYVVINKR